MIPVGINGPPMLGQGIGGGKPVGTPPQFQGVPDPMARMRGVFYPPIQPPVQMRSGPNPALMQALMQRFSGGAAR